MQAEECSIQQLLVLGKFNPSPRSHFLHLQNGDVSAGLNESL